MRKQVFCRNMTEAREIKRKLVHKADVYNYNRKSDRYFYMIELCNHLNRHSLVNWEAKIAQAIIYYPICVAWNGKERI